MYSQEKCPRGDWQSVLQTTGTRSRRQKEWARSRGALKSCENIVRRPCQRLSVTMEIVLHSETQEKSPYEVENLWYRIHR